MDDAGPFLRFSAIYEADDEKAEDALMAETEQRLKNIQPAGPWHPTRGRIVA
jgi:hypothetical protein